MGYTNTVQWRQTGRPSASRRFEFVDWKSTLISSFRRKPESRRLLNLHRKTSLDAGVRRHDQLLRRL